MHDSGLGDVQRMPGGVVIGDGRPEDLGQLPVCKQDGAEFSVVNAKVLAL
jgi:hypothetical protein